MDKTVIKRPSPSVRDNSVIESKVRKLIETLSDVKISRKSLNQKANKKDRKCQDNYIEFGFTFVIEKGERHPKCVICLYLYSGLIIKFKKIQIA